MKNKLRPPLPDHNPRLDELAEAWRNIQWEATSKDDNGDDIMTGSASRDDVELIDRILLLMGLH